MNLPLYRSAPEILHLVIMELKTHCLRYQRPTPRVANITHYVQSQSDL